jgi:membrane protease YdiL (CAAX protease family)
MSLKRPDDARAARRPGGPPRVWPVYLLFVLSLVGTGAATVALIWGSYMLSHVQPAPSRSALMEHALLPTTFVLTIVLSAVILSGLSFAAAGLSRVPVVERLNLRRSKSGILPVLAGMVGLPALSMVIENVALFSGVEIGGTLQMIAQTIGSAHGLTSVFIVLAISLGPGFGEELLFRGYIQTRLVERHSPLVGIIVTSLLFGLMHMDPLQSTLTVFMGGYLGFLACRFGTIWPAVGAHALNNGLSAVSLTLFPEEPTNAAPSLLGMGLGGAAFVACLLYVLRRVPARSP